MGLRFNCWRTCLSNVIQGIAGEMRDVGPGLQVPRPSLKEEFVKTPFTMVKTREPTCGNPVV